MYFRKSDHVYASNKYILVPQISLLKCLSGPLGSVSCSARGSCAFVQLALESAVQYGLLVEHCCSATSTVAVWSKEYSEVQWSTVEYSEVQGVQCNAKSTVKVSAVQCSVRSTVECKKYSGVQWPQLASHQNVYQCNYRWPECFLISLCSLLHCTALQYGAVQCSAVPFSAVQDSVRH